MKVFKSSWTVEWAHCDFAGIVYYPHFYTWFDQATERMMKDMGFPYSTLAERYNVLGVPLLETGATYSNTCRLGDRLEMETRVDEFSEKTFLVRHRLRHADGRLALEGFERRVMVRRDADSIRGMKATTIPADIVKQFALE